MVCQEKLGVNRNANEDGRKDEWSGGLRRFMVEPEQSRGYQQMDLTRPRQVCNKLCQHETQSHQCLSFTSLSSNHPIASSLLGRFACLQGALVRFHDVDAVVMLRGKALSLMLSSPHFPASVCQLKRNSLCVPGNGLPSRG